MKLQDMIRTRRAQLGLTWDALARRSVAAGHPIKRSMWYHWADTEWSNIPPTDTIRGIAAALELDEDEVLAAAAESVNIGPRELHLDRGRRAVLALLADRSPAEIAALEQVVRAAARAMDLPAAAAQPESDNHALNGS